ncbi:hypothetical protein [Myceligenerans xiligouense]|uniref:Fibronectin type-III domain-containing protein n=1 Tax=Myceligenerans xiligouense TaxID=253184 RepID=A0A3N4YXN5_9MICO|nr:hypothetical protein [Myceligenerans xiligouense]RPF23400.1 hypothetical protein EDD34_4087 [Myceligenerans xiligouense]
MFPYLFARPRGQATQWAAGVAVTALVGTTLVTGGEPAAAAMTTVELPSTVLATADELPGGTITRVELTDSLIVLEVADDGLSPQVWTRDRNGTDPAWHQVDGMEGLRAAEGDLVRGSLAGVGDAVVRVPDGAHRVIPDEYQVDRGGRHVSSLDGTSVTIQDAISGSSVAAVPLGHRLTTSFGGYRAAESLIATVDTNDLRHVDVPTGRVLATEDTLCDDSHPEGEPVGFDGRFTLVRCSSGEYSLHDRDVYRPALITYGSGGDVSDSWSLNDGVLIGVSDDIHERPAVMNPWTGVIGYALGAPTSPARFDGHGDLGVFASGDALYAVDLTPVISDVLTVAPDSAAPSVTMGGSTWSATRAYTVTFKSSDADATPDDQYRASGVRRTEARHRTRPRGHDRFGAWSAPFVVGTSRDATAPAGSRTCWQARAKDNAGNLGSWSAERCVQIDGAAPSITSRGLPTAIKATGTTTKVTFRWSAEDKGGIDRYTLRHRATPRGQRTVAWTYASMGKDTSYTKGRAKSRTVCFQVKARDLAGNVSAWSKLRCTYVDGIKPKVSKATMKRWMPTWSDWKSGLVQWHPTFSYAGKDDKGVYRYQRQTKASFESAGLSSTSTSGWLTSTSRRFTLNPVDQACARVRVKDRAGNVSAWSPWRCSNAPADWRFGVERSSAHVTYAREVGIPVGYSGELMINGTRGAAQTRTDRSYRVRAVRLHMATGPTMGKVHVYVGSTRLGTVDTRRSTWGMKSLTVRSSKELSGRVRLVAASGTTATSHLYVIR